MKYIQNHEKNSECIFCSALSLDDGTDNLVIMRGEKVFAILNRYPYTSGHLMIVPFKHQASLEELDPVTRAELMECTTQFMTILRKIYHPQAFNIGANIGEAAGAGVVGHVHIHIVPRWTGDTNFMSTLSETRVLPETIEETYLRVQAEWILKEKKDSKKKFD